MLVAPPYPLNTTSLPVSSSNEVTVADGKVVVTSTISLFRST